MISTSRPSQPKSTARVVPIMPIVPDKLPENIARNLQGPLEKLGFILDDKGIMKSMQGVYPIHRIRGANGYIALLYVNGDWLERPHGAGFLSNLCTGLQNTDCGDRPCLFFLSVSPRLHFDWEEQAQLCQSSSVVRMVRFYRGRFIESLKEDNADPKRIEQQMRDWIQETRLQPIQPIQEDRMEKRPGEDPKLIPNPVRPSAQELSAE